MGKARAMREGIMNVTRNNAAVLILAMLIGLSACRNGGGNSNGNPPTSGNPPPTVTPPGEPGAELDGPRTRYAMANRCFAMQSVSNDKFVVAADGGYSATADAAADGEAFFLKPAALGDYLIYDSSATLMNGGAPVATQSLSGASDAAIWAVLGSGDATSYPERPGLHEEPTAELVAAYRGFVEPQNNLFSAFTLSNRASAQQLLVDEAGVLTTASEAEGTADQFRFVPLQEGCAVFPEAQSNVEGETFSGTTEDGRVLGMADVHVHISATEFLGRAQWGWPFHPLGVTHALGDCNEYHGEEGSQDAVGAFLGGDQDGHNTTGWPTFPDWPGRDALTHEAIYWKWLERSWKAGLRIVVNDLVDNETLCELQRNAAGDPSLDCNPMNSAARQAGTMYLMQDYIDAQYGGRGAGWFQIVHTADEARAVIEQGKMAVILGIEISNFLNCQVTYNSPNRSLEPFEEDGSGGFEASYGCSMEETGADNEIKTQLERLWGLGVRQVISIHEFDNAFGGNGIFLAFLNLGNKENSGGIPGGALAGPFPTVPEESASGEFWTTYDCPLEEDQPYLWGDQGGESGALLRSFGQNNNASDPSANCFPMGQGGRYGGPTNCYPNGQQCNARWMTPIGLYLYKKLMEMGFIFDFDHMELAMKDQALDLTEAQPIAYPIVSTHGTFGGTSIAQAQRVLRNGGVLYPSIGRSTSFMADMDETLGVYNEVWADTPAEERPLFGFGFGTDTNGLSGQSPPRSNTSDKPVVYPFSLFTGDGFSDLPDFDAITGLAFDQPAVTDAAGVQQRTWHVDSDGNAHHGMLSDTVHEIQLEGTAEHLRHLYNSAEVYLRMWKRTEEASAAIQDAGGAAEPADILRAAPTP